MPSGTDFGPDVARFPMAFRTPGEVIQLNLPPPKDECTGVRILSESSPRPAAPRHRWARRGRRWAGGAAVAGLLLALAVRPAAADVKLVPDTGVRGAAAEVGFVVSEDRAPAAYTTQIQIVMPNAQPIAEVYPLSNNDWGPRIAYRDLATGLPGVHGPVSNTVVTDITWVRFGKPAAPTTETTNELRVSLGPLPQADDVRFLVVQTYSDGVVKRWVDPVMTLTPAAGQGAQPSAPAQGPTHGQAHGGAIPGASQPAAAPADSSSGGHLGVVIGVLVALLVGVAIGGAVVAAGRMRPGGAGPEETAASDPDGTPDDSTADDAAPAETSPRT
jgi:hypothetical protein